VWTDVIEDRFPSPDEDAVTDWFSRISMVIAIGLLLVAYALYPQSQSESFGATISGALKSFSMESIFRNAGLIAGLFVLVAVTLRISWKEWVKPLLYAIHPIIVMLVWFWIFFHIHNSLGDGHHDGRDFLLWWPAAWFYFWAFIAGMYTFYRIIKYRFGAHTLHPALAQIMELALAERALTVALEGKATILYLPQAPVKLITLGLAALAVAYFAIKALMAEYGFLRERDRTFHKPFIGLWHRLTARRTTWQKRAKALWEFQYSHVARFWTSIVVVTAVMVAAATFGWF